MRCLLVGGSLIATIFEKSLIQNYAMGNMVVDLCDLDDESYLVEHDLLSNLQKHSMEKGSQINKVEMNTLNQSQCLVHSWDFVVLLQIRLPL